MYTFQGTNKPFRAPVYSGYKEVLKALANQGLLGFYKGNLIGIIYHWMNSYLRFNSLDMLDYKNYKFYHEGSPFLKGFVGKIQFLLIYLSKPKMKTSILCTIK